MKIVVHHLDELALLGPNPAQAPREFLAARFGFGSDGSQQAACLDLFERGFYNRVAEVEAASLGEAWELTNHADSDWRANPGVEAAPGSRRSSCVGDIFELPGGALRVVASLGFSPLREPARSARPRASKLGR